MKKSLTPSRVLKRIKNTPCKQSEVINFSKRRSRVQLSSSSVDIFFTYTRFLESGNVKS